MAEAGPRHVLLVGGFDPHPPRHVHRAMRRTLRERPAGRPALHLGPLQPVDAGRADWTLNGPSGRPAVRFSLLAWDDCVRPAWVAGPGRALRDAAFVYPALLRQGVLGRIRRLARPAHAMAVLPLALGLGGPLGGAALAAGGAALAGAGAAPLLAAAAAGGLGGAVLAHTLGRRLHADWLLRLYGHTRAQALGRTPALEARIEAWATALIEAAEALAAATPAGAPRGELLLVGHSTGSLLAVSALARALRRAPGLGRQGPALAMLSLGHCTPILAELPEASAFRAELATLRACAALDWLDVSAPTDWAGFPRSGPWYGEDGPMRRRQVSPQFHKALTPAAYARLLKDRQALHLQYLRSPERADGYDPFELFAGPHPLAERLRWPSPWQPPA